MDRRTAIKWMVTAAASMSLLDLQKLAAITGGTPLGYGMNPDMARRYQPGDLWPLTFTPAQRQTATALCDTIIPADAESPAASAVGVPDFIDEWISAPYGDAQFEGLGVSSIFARDRALFLEGIAWLDGQSLARYGRGFAGLSEDERRAICDEICNAETARPEFKQPAAFFARFRDLTAGGFYTTPEGRKDLKYVGNMPLAQFDGPPPEVLKKVGVTP